MENWKTTLAGVGGAVALTLSNYLSSLGGGAPMRWQDLVQALIMAAVGYFAHDAQPTKK